MILAHALAEVMDVDATEGEEVLYASVDPTSLDNLFKNQFDGTARDQGHITLTVDEYLMIVSSGGRIEITPQNNSEE
ncbi:HalOD1 output domain-containing protein [Haladaptatus litoreus]